MVLKFGYVVRVDENKRYTKFEVDRSMGREVMG